MEAHAVSQHSTDILNSMDAGSIFCCNAAMSYVPIMSNIKWRQHFLWEMPETRQGCTWLHACSMGEVASVLPLLRALHAQGRQLYVTVVTRTGFALAQEKLQSMAEVAYVPWDLPWQMTRFVARLQPATLLLTETEFWPGMLRACHQHGVTVIGINTRISDRSFPKYYATRYLWRRWLAHVDMFLPQSDVDAERLVAMGVAPQRVQALGNLKYAVATPVVDATALRRRLDVSGQRPILLVASTHHDEEQRILKMWATWRRIAPDLMLLLVPRHPERFEQVAEQVQAQGLSLQRWSEDCATYHADVLLVDAMGVLQSLYTIADIAVIGGSLVSVGGHNPLEAAVCGRSVITGPYIHNFRQVMADMQQASAAVVAANDDELEAAVSHSLQHPEALRDMHAHAALFMRNNQQVLVRVCDAIEAVEHQSNTSEIT